MSRTTCVAIRCHSSAPIADSDVARWLQERLEGVRAEAPRAAVRLTHLAQQLPDTVIDAGWLIELELQSFALSSESRRAQDQVADVVRDLRMIGLNPVALHPMPLPLQIGDLFDPPTAGAQDT